MGRGVAALSRQRQHSDINMRRSDWRDGELRQLLTIMGEKEMQSHYRRPGKMVVYEKDAEEPALPAWLQNK